MVIFLRNKELELIQALLKAALETKVIIVVILEQEQTVLQEATALQALQDLGLMGGRPVRQDQEATAHRAAEVVIAQAEVVGEAQAHQGHLVVPVEVRAAQEAEVADHLVVHLAEAVEDNLYRNEKVFFNSFKCLFG